MIDDDADDIYIFTEALKAINKDIVFRSYLNPKQALEVLRSSGYVPDLIFLDYNMPSINGLEVLEQLKDEKHLRNTLVILISSPDEQIMKKQLLHYTMVKYISKPSGYNELVGALREILES